MTPIKVGSQVFNPSISESSPNYVGKVIEMKPLKIATGEQVDDYCIVAFRDYQQGFRLGSLKKARIYRKFQFYCGGIQAGGMYNFSPKDETDTRLSYWFDREEYNRLKRMTAHLFNLECERILSEQPED